MENIIISFKLFISIIYNFELIKHLISILHYFNDAKTCYKSLITYIMKNYKNVK